MRLNLVVTLVLLTLTGVAAADQGRTEIGPTDVFPIVIDQPGSYVLTSDLHMTTTGSSAIEITADDVTLDLGGHVIHGPGPGVNGTGIYGDERTGVSVFNGTVTGFSGGIRFTGGGTAVGVNRFHDLAISHIEFGPGLGFNGGEAHDIVVTDVSVPAMNGEGVGCSNCSLSNVTVRSSYEGIKLNHGTAVNCAAIGNGTGFILTHASLTGGAAIDSSYNGVVAHAQSTMIGVTVSGNGGWGFYLDVDGNNNLVNCTGGDNTAGNVSGCGSGNGCHQNYLP